ncbi:MAG: hypothetical protein HC815_41835 [Richelia sp. RM1_1_1]|nr:hypothetical protein [Richelia sp. RM1_1_1]
MQNGKQVLVENAVVVAQGFTTANAPNNNYANLLPPQVVSAQTVIVPSFVDLRDQELTDRVPVGSPVVTFNPSQNPINNANEWNQRFPAPGTASNPRVVRVTGGLNIPSNVSLSNYVIQVENGDINFNGSNHVLNNVLLTANNINLSGIQGTDVAILASSNLNMNGTASFAGESVIHGNNLNFNGRTANTTTDFLRVVGQGDININNLSNARGEFLSGRNITFNGNPTIVGSIEAKGDVRFNGRVNMAGIVASSTTDTTPPAISVSLVNDTGLSNTDRITNDPTIAGTITDASAISELRAGINGAPSFDILTNLTNGSFNLTRERLNQIAGGSLANGAVTLNLQARDSAGNLSAVVPFNFTFDNVNPALTIDLDPAFDTAPIGDRQNDFWQDVTFKLELLNPNSRVNFGHSFYHCELNRGFFFR